MANIVTGSRILLSILLLFIPAFSPLFNGIYLICGLTDMVDGTIARKTNTECEFGSRLDTIADFVFVVVCLVKLLPVMDIPTWLWIWIAIIAVIKMINVISGFACQKKFVAVHTIMNKLTGLLLFAFPFATIVVDLKYCGLVVCVVATFTAIQEGHYIRTGREVS